MCVASDSVDGTIRHAWITEAPTANNNKGSLTEEGVENIANHKYVPGHYTSMDTLLDPFWKYMTEFLPMTMAPNMVTFIGAMHCAVAYATVWYYSANFDKHCPDWVVFMCGYCTIAYYTFDCMDGKQARRTGTSSPLGQLFDHGFDCMCTLSHISSVAQFLRIGGDPEWLMVFQTSLQLSFLMAQWEEYYTHILPHAQGDFGVTEMNYGIGLFTIANAFIDRDAFWGALVKDMLPSKFVEEFNYIPEVVFNMEFRHFGLAAWFGLVIFVTTSCIVRVLTHERVVANGGIGLKLSALSKLFSPLVICVAPFLLPKEVMVNETRYIAVSTGLLFSYLTKKMICFSMAKQTYATFQVEAIPYCAIMLWIRLDDNITAEGASLLLKALCVWNAYRLVNWASIAIDQICKRLDIYCFTIKQKKV
eukprot:939094_1